jgi:hypothetical protein
LADALTAQRVAGMEALVRAQSELSEIALIRRAAHHGQNRSLDESFT